MDDQPGEGKPNRYGMGWECANPGGCIELVLSG